MANKQVAHIKAKLEGGNVGEVLDIYDETALHSYDIANNLTTTTAGKVLDATQGKFLKDQADNTSSSLTTLTARVNNIANLPSGSTTGDAELIDIRVGYDNTTYTNAGTAVRSQVYGLNNQIKNTMNTIGTVSPLLELGNFSGSDIWSLTQNDSTTIARSSILTDIKACTITSKYSDLRLTLFYTDTNPQTGSTYVQDYGTLTVPVSAKYARLRIQVASSTTSISSLVGELDDLITIDYTDSYGSRMEDIENNIKAIDSQINGEITSLNYVYGGISTSGESTVTNARIHTDSEVDFNSAYRLLVPSKDVLGFAIRGYILFYDDSDNIIDTNALWTDMNNDNGDITISFSSYAVYEPTDFNIVIRKDDNTDITSEEVQKIKDGIILRLEANLYKDTIFKKNDLVLTDDELFSINVPVSMLDNIIICTEAKYEGIASNNYLRPMISVRSGFGKFTSENHIGEENVYSRNEIRAVPVPYGYNSIDISIKVPSGITLNIRTIEVRYDNNVTRSKNALEINSHAGLLNVPPLSRNAVEIAAAVGALKCVVIPKRTSDGVWLCYHDDTFDVSTTHLRNSDGSVITDTTYNGSAFSDIPFNYLNSFDWGISTNAIYAGTKPLLLSDYFKICAKTGMHPMLSMHPNATTTAANMQEIRNMAIKYGVTSTLNIKCPQLTDGSVGNIRRAFEAFGYEIESYTVDTRNNGDVSTAIANFEEINIDKTKVECVIEQFAGSTTLTSESINAILQAGYKAGVATNQHTSIDGVSRSSLCAIDFDYYIEQGVTVFTEPKFLSFGLNW